MIQDELNALSGRVLDAAFLVHTQLGPGLLESAYEACLCFGLRRGGLAVEQQVALPLIYQGQKLGDVGYRLDLLVEGELIVEVKAVEQLAPIHHAQLLSYLRLSRNVWVCSSTSTWLACGTGSLARSTSFKCQPRSTPRLARSSQSKLRVLCENFANSAVCSAQGAQHANLLGSQGRARKVRVHDGA